MRVALVLYGEIDTISGGFLYDRMLLNYLRRQGCQVEVVSLPWRGYLGGFQDNLSPSHQRRLKSIKCDLLLQDEHAHPSLIRFNRSRQSQGRAPTVAIVHHLRSSEARPAWQQFLYRIVERRYLKSVTGFIFNSRATKETVERLTGPGKPAALALPGGNRFAGNLSAEAIAARSREPGPLRLLFLGNLIPRKGLHLLLEALTLLPKEGWQLTVVGGLDKDPEYVRQILRQISRTGLEGQVTCTGALRDQGVAECLARSHVLAVPSTYEGFGIVYLEAMAFGLPPLATMAGGARELITSGKNGFLTAPGDISALAGHLRALMEDRELLLAMSLAARARFAAHPTWEETGAAIYRFLQGFLRDGHP